MSRELVTCRPDESLAAAAKRMLERDVSCLPVSNGRDRWLLGILTDRDLCTQGVARGWELSRHPVEALMRTPVRTCWPDDSLEAARAIMRAYRIRRLPVVERDGRLCGLIGLSDMARRVVARPSDPAPARLGGETVETLAALSGPGG